MIKQGAAYDVIFGIVTAVGHTIPEAPTGGTVRLSGGSLPSSGYWVGGAGGQTLVYDSFVVMSGPEVVAFVAACPTDYVGWWVDSETGKIHVDHVEWFPEESDAMIFAASWSEIAIYDISNAKEIRL